MDDGLVSPLIENATEDEKLSSNLKDIEQVLEEADRRKLIDQQLIDRLEMLEDVWYEIDDALDEWEVTKIRHQFQRSDDHVGGTWWNKVCSFFPSLCLCFGLQHMTLRIKRLNNKVDRIVGETPIRSLLPTVPEPQDFEEETTTAFNDQVVKLSSQEDSKNHLLKLIFSEKKREDVQVIALVGTEGIGKTTLAQLVFNDPRVDSNFRSKSWIYTSTSYDAVRVAKAVLDYFDEGASNSTNSDSNLPSGDDENVSGFVEFGRLLDRISYSIQDAKFFLVLDNVEVDYDWEWRQLEDCLKSGARGSRVLVTTRNRGIADRMEADPVITLDPLSDSDCWSLLSQIAFRGKPDEDRKKLEDVGREIARRCEGLPLKACTIGNILRFKYSREEWNNILECGE